ncbi:MAG: GGDEF domain-containing protein [Smithella sp.]|nr:GGDEF domain-containing protein [Smithella sp.]MDM7988345.1 diguanylate cyclase [Smithella sp.]HOU51388.1 diguanylate cyclase [Smithella sp.]HQG66093.1 diguanylate cyclase [Smithella sp.]HQI72540.1 diguanylate cyclase [Smithella sp.]
MITRRSIHFTLRAILCFVFLITLSARADSQTNAIGVTPERPVIEIAEHSEYLLDSKDALTYQDIIRGALPFQRHMKNSFQFSFKKATLWIKCSVVAATGDQQSARSFLVFDNAALGSITLWVPVFINGRADTIELKGGWQQGNSSNEFPFLYPAFLLPDNIDASRPLIVRVSTPYALQFRSTLYTTDAFRKNSFILFLIVGFFTGILAAMILYNIVLYLFVRDKHYIFYILYVFFLLLWQCVLIGLFRYFHPPLGEFLLSYITAWSALMMMFAIIFGIIYLNMAKTAPRHDILLKVIAAAMGAIVILVLFRFLWTANVAAYLVGQVATIVLFTSALSAFLSGFRPARYYLIAVSIFLVSAIIFLFRFYGLVPNNTFTMHIMMFGSAAEAILLSFALGYRIRLLKEEEELLKERERSLEAISVTDELTGLFNRRFFNASLVKKIAASRRSGTNLSLLMMDVDYFKSFNDTYGHMEGDKVLSGLGKLLTQILREEDIACRYGGEEFVVILHNADMKIALETAERIRTGFEAMTFRPGLTKDIHVTVSIGAAELLPGDSPDQFLLRADKALYQAKNDGRNRVCSL